MARWIGSLGSSVLLAWSLLASQCVVCPQMRAEQAVPHACCSPASHNHGGWENLRQATCPGHDLAFESHGKAGPTAPASLIHWFFKNEIPVPVTPANEPGHTPATQGLAHPPPDHCLLNSVLLI